MAGVESRGAVDAVVEKSKVVDYIGVVYGAVTGSVGIVLLSLGLLWGKNAYINRKK